MYKRNIILVSIAATILAVLGIRYFKSDKKSSFEPHSYVTFSLDQFTKKKKLIDMAVIGSGPAGWSAALYGARLGNYTVVISGSLPGGQLTKTSYIENWPGFERIKGGEVMDQLAAQAKTHGAEELKDTVTAVDLTSWPYALKTEGGHTLYAATLVVATGSSPRLLNIPGEQEFWGKGVSTCAICDAPFYKNKTAVVVGGGDSAAEEALQLAVYAKKVNLLVRKNTMRASHVMQQRLAGTPNIKIMYEVEPERVTGVETVKAVELRNKKTNELTVMPTDGFFIAIGHLPNTDLFKGAHNLLEPNGYVKVRPYTQETSIPGVFAAGDVEDERYRQAGVAAGHGIAAGIDADRFLREVGLTSKVREELKRKDAYFADFSLEHVDLATLDSLESFNEQVASKEGLFVLDFTGQHCPTCKQMLPIIEAAAVRFEGKINFYKVDVDHAKDIVMHLKVPKVPYILIFKDGVRIAFFNRPVGRTEFFDYLNSILAK